ncbi:MAG: hypothetical protein JWN13_4205 [Betaproteobacteria bacterium]|jgi:ElaB/YqjD/DUF883 family membrane-anchored ribosome-binding protein|nr:hypothetical protein [Betaproteobacteria bacterium]MEA3155321.1 hypothetical protein [Betaproteobacteria bacterium]
MASAGNNTPDTSSRGPTGALNAASAAAHDLVDKVGGPAEKVASRVTATTDTIRQAGHSAVDKAVNAAAPAAQWLDQKQSYVQDQLKTTTDYVVGNPLKAIAIAFVAGVLVGRITS